MGKRMMRVGAPIAVAAIALSAVGGAMTASASTKHPSTKSYTIAYQGPLSGGNAQLGLNMLYAVELAVNQANAGTTFGKLPFKLKFTKADDQGSPTQSPTAAQSLINNSNVVAVVGPAFSGATKAAEPLFSAANLATVSPSATAPSLATYGWKNFFRVVADDNSQGPGAAQYVVKKLGFKSVYSIDDASAYAQGLVSAFNSSATALGATVTHQTVPGTTFCQAGTGDVTEYTSLASTIKQANPGAVFYAGYYCDFALVAKQLRAAGYTGTLFSDDGSLDPHYISSAGSTVAQGTYFSCACTNLGTSKTDLAFSKSFKKLAKFAVGTYSAEAYDAANAIIAAMKKIKGTITRGAVVKAVSKVVYQGLTKRVHFNSNGNIAGTAVYIYEVKSGNIAELGAVSQLVK